MLKLKRLQQQQAAAKAAPKEGEEKPAETPAETTTAPTTEGGEKKDGATTYVLKKQNSKELLANRKSKSKENVFSLRTNRGAKRGKKTNAAELRATKGTFYLHTKKYPLPIIFCVLFWLSSVLIFVY